MLFLYIIFFSPDNFGRIFYQKKNGGAFGKNKLGFNFTIFANLLEN
jgi:hypothetical protein